MANKRIDITLGVTADTSKAKQTLQSLQVELRGLQSKSLNIDDAGLKKASEAAKQLQMHLQNALNTTTGNIDLSKLDASLKKSGTSVKQLGNDLLASGVHGEQAFVKLSQSIANAEYPALRLSKTMRSLATTMLSTLKWQISSSLLHGFIGSIQQAYGYAKDLNESLNNIRIVTGYNVETMSRFAESANKAAKNLSTSTLDYTKASLIYYQQGLGEEEVEARTRATIKMANVTGQAAQTVSDQMTAIWNNFDDGSKSLEYYADVITALGAATASSSDEIAKGLEKFIAVADTVGLSYEYATAALATVTAETRQSADVVGTAFKTLFARIEGLSLGETLDDGTTLNKYSEALSVIGVNIKDQNSELKTMDSILNEMGEKWKMLNEDQQVALAQTVGGVRQYNQLMSLMNNWDTFKVNLEIGTNSEGTLENQQAIYEESWEASSKRVRASLEELWTNLFDDSFFIKLNDGLASVVEGVSNVIKSFGGIKNIIISLGAIFVGVFANKIQPLFQQLKSNIVTMFIGTGKQIQAISKETQASITEATSGRDFTILGKQQLENAQNLIGARAKLALITSSLNQAERDKAERELESIAIEQQEAEKIAEKIQLLKEEREELLKVAGAADMEQSGSSIIGSQKLRMKSFEREQNRIMTEEPENTTALNAVVGEQLRYSEAARDLNSVLEVQSQKLGEVYVKNQELKAANLPQDLEASKQAMNAFIDSLSRYATMDSSAPIEDQKAKLMALSDMLRSMPADTEESKSAIENLQEQIQDALKIDSKDKFGKALEEIQGKINGLKGKVTDLNKTLNRTNPNFTKKLDKNLSKSEKETEKLRKKQEALNKAYNAFNPKHVVTGVERIAKIAGLAGSISMVMNSVKSMASAIGDADMSPMERFSTILMSASMLIPSLIKSITTIRDLTASWGIVQNQLNILQSKSIAQGIAQNIIDTTKITNDQKEILGKTLLAKAVGKKNAAQLAEHAADIAEVAIDAIKNKQTDTEIIKSALVSKGIAGETASKLANTIATWAQTSANWGLFASLGPIAIIIGIILLAVVALTAAIWALVAAYQAIVKGDKVDTTGAETLMEEAKATQELIDKQKELRNSMDELIEEHNKLNQAGENTAETIDNIKEKLPELIAGYRGLAEALDLDLAEELGNLENQMRKAILTGEFDEAQETQKEIDKEIAEANFQKQKIGTDSAKQLTLATLQDEAQGKYDKGSGTYTLNVGDFWDTEGAKDVYAALQKYAPELTLDYVVGWNEGSKITFDTKNTNKFIEQFEALEKARSKMLTENPNAVDSDSFREIDEFLQAGMEDFKALKEQAEIVNQAAGEALEARFENRVANLDSLIEYNQYREDFIMVAQNEYKLTQKQAEALFEQQKAVEGLTNKYKLASTFLDKFQGGLKMEDLTQYQRENLAKAFDEITKDLSDTEIVLAIDVMANAESLDDFNEQMRHVAIEATRIDYQATALNAKNLLNDEESLENKKFDSTQLAKLTNNEEFQNFLQEQKNITEEQFMLWNYDEQYSLITEFYSNVQKLANETYKYQEGLYYQDLAKYSNMMSKMASIDEDTRQEMLDTQAQYESKKAELETISNDTTLSKEEKQEKVSEIQNELNAMAKNYQITYGIDINLNEVDITNKIKQIGDEIDALNKKKIEIATSWDGIEKVEKSLENISGFASFMRKDAKKVGDSYELTAAQAREWAKVYPELFANAKVTNTGIMKLNAAETEDFLDKQETQSDASIEAEIISLEAQKESFLAKIKMREQDLLAAKALEEGKIQLENVSAEYLTDLRQNLTQKYLDMGFEETEANKKALETMGVNEEEYSALVADAAQVNADNTIDSVEIGAQAQAKEINWLQQKWINFTNLLGDVANAIVKALTGDWSGFENLFKAKDTSTSSGGTTFTAQTLTSDSTFTAGEETKVRTEDLLAQTSDDLFAGITDDINEYKDTVANIDTQIAMLKAYQLQSLSDYGSDDVDDVKAGDGTGDSGDDKEVEDLEIPEETVERYKEINDALEEAEHRTDKLSRAMDKAYGAEKIKKINEVNKSLAEEIGLLQARLEEESGYLVRDAASVMTQSVKLGDETHLMGFDVDEKTGIVTNYNAVMKAWNQKLAEATAHYNSLGTEEEREAYKKAVIEPIEKALEDSEEAVSKLDETRNQKKETETQIEEKKDEIKENKIEGIKYKVELRMELSEEDREQIEKQIEALGEKIYTSEERVIKLMEKLPSLDNDLKAIKEADQKLEEMYAGKEKDTAYYEAKKELRDRAKDVVEAAEEMGEAIREAWLNAFESAVEEIEKITNKWEGLNGQLEHYQNVLGLIGRENDFEAQNILLDGQMALAEDQLETSKATLDMYKAQRKEKQQELDDYKKGVAEGTREQDQLWEDSLTANIEAIDEAIDETQSKIYENTEAYFEYAKQKWENLGKIAAKELSDALAGKNYSSLEDLADTLERNNSLKEGFLTKTNQLYESNKLISTAQLAIDKTSNNVAKQKYKDYINYVDQLKNSNEMSEYDLKIAQQRYELLQAQIALEEAQNAKSQVKLTRDASGNWGYMYTASDNKVAEAEQKVADAENKLYNTSLDNVKNINSQQVSILQKYYDTAQDLLEKFQSGEIKSKAEYDKKMENLEKTTRTRLLKINNEFYKSKNDLMKYSSNNLEDYLTVDIINISEFDLATQNYTSNIEQYWNEWGDTVKTVSDQAGLDFISFGDTVSREVSEINLNLKGLKDETGNVKTASNELKVALIGENGTSGLVKALADELTAVSNVVTKTGEHATKLDAVKTAAEAFVTYSTETLRPELDLLDKTDVDIDITVNSNIADTVETAKEKLAEIPKAVTTYIETVRLPEGETAPTDDEVPDGDDEVPDGDDDTDNTKRFTKTIDNSDVSYMGGGYLDLGNGKAIHFTDMFAYRDWKEGDPLPTPSELEGHFDAHPQMIDPDKIKNFVGWDDTSNKNLINPTLMAYGTGEEGSGNGWFTLYDGKYSEIDYQIEDRYTDPDDGTTLYKLNGKWYTNKSVRFSGTKDGKDYYRLNPTAVPTTYYTTPTLKQIFNLPADLIRAFWGGKVAKKRGGEFVTASIEADDWDFNAKIDKIETWNEKTMYRLTKPVQVEDQDYYWVDSKVLSLMGGVTETDVSEKLKEYISKLTNFDTGGYTGSWGNEGKLAVLHEKEIILNQQDTTNFLNAIEMVRSISDFIDKNAATSALGVLGFGQTNVSKVADQMIQQEVNIYADFPDAQDHNEIAVALQNLVNQASQYANRNN